MARISRGMEARLKERAAAGERVPRFSVNYRLFAAAASIAILVGAFVIYTYLFKNEASLQNKELTYADIPAEAEESVPAGESLAATNYLDEKKDISEADKQVLDIDIWREKSEPLTPLEEDVSLNDEILEMEYESKSPEILEEAEIDNEDLEEVGYAAEEAKAIAAEEITAEEPAPEPVPVTGVSGAASDYMESKGGARKAQKKSQPPASLKEQTVSPTRPIFNKEAYKDLQDFLAKNMEYPDSALKAGLQGKVILEFTIDKNGIINELKVRQSSHRIFEKEALRLISSTGVWQPATENGKPVSFLMFIPVDFLLPEK